MKASHWSVATRLNAHKMLNGVINCLPVKVSGFLFNICQTKIKKLLSRLLARANIFILVKNIIKLYSKTITVTQKKY